MQTIPHYNIDKLNAVGAQFNILYGERSNGKSYQLKHKMMITPEVLTGKKRFMLVRRSKNEITTEKIMRYFNDVDIEKLTGCEYNAITMWRRELFLSQYNVQTCKVKRFEKIGYVVPLEDEQYYAGASFTDVTDIIFEEFMSRSKYLHDEPNKLMNLYCTVDRKKGDTRLWLCGNSISRVCPYLTDWDIMDIMRTQKQGTIKTKKFDVGAGQIVDMAIEYCENTNTSSFVIGSHAQMLSTGEWQSDPQPHLPESLKNYNTIFTCVFAYKSFTFLARHLIHDQTGERCWFICDKKTPVKPGTIVLTDVIMPSSYYFRDPYHVRTRNRRIEEILGTFTEDKIFYSTDLCGTDFKQAIDFIIKR